MTRCVFIKLRLSNKDDFADQFGNKKIGQMYFIQSFTGQIEKNPRYFTEETDLKVFRELYTSNQIYVTENPFDCFEITELEDEITN